MAQTCHSLQYVLSEFQVKYIEAILYATQYSEYGVSPDMHVNNNIFDCPVAPSHSLTTKTFYYAYGRWTRWFRVYSCKNAAHLYCSWGRRACGVLANMTKQSNIDVILECLCLRFLFNRKFEKVSVGGWNLFNSHLTLTKHTHRIYSEKNFQQRITNTRCLLADPLVVLDFRLHLGGDLREAVANLTHRGILGDADGLELLQLGVQVLQVHSSQLGDVLGDSSLSKGKILVQI